MREQPRVITQEILHILIKDTEPWLSCDDCFEMLDEYADRRLVDRDDAHTSMVTHLEACPACAEEAASLLALIANDE
ncbi:MAG TPA: hypothetical protein VEX15_20150 [Nocardioidaceae bacterium]|nr:hypothetical protein [Nocardioidaceae bacterium]